MSQLLMIQFSGLIISGGTYGNSTETFPPLCNPNSCAIPTFPETLYFTFTGNLNFNENFMILNFSVQRDGVTPFLSSIMDGILCRVAARSMSGQSPELWISASLGARDNKTGWNTPP